MNERDIIINFENKKLYDLGETYNVKITDKNGNPIKKGYACFLIYNRIFYSNITEAGIATCTLPLDLNFTGNILVWTIYSDGEMYDLAASEAISIGTKTLVSLDQTTIGSRMVNNLNKYNFTFKEGKHIGQIDNNTYLIIEYNGNCYLLYETTINSSEELMSQFKTLSQKKNKYDVVKLNLLNNITYILDKQIFNDKEWGYTSSITSGQLIINGNGATIKGNYDLNFMYIGTEANTNFYNLTISNFDHCFINHGNLMSKNCSFRDNEAYKFDVKVWGSGTVIHNFNTIFFDSCSFYDNEAKFSAFGKEEMGGSILYAEPYSLNIFKDIIGSIKTDSFYCDNYTTTIIYDSNYEEVHKLLSDSFISQNAYFSIVNDKIYSSNKTWVANVSNIQELKQVLWTLNTFINATEVIINMEPGEYVFDKDFEKLRGCNWRAKDQDHEKAIDYIQNRYILDIGYCPITINGNGATISIKGNDKDQDYHFAYIGKYGHLTLNNLELKNFNTALMVTGSVVANQTTFKDNIIDYTFLDGDRGGAIRSLGGTVICHNCKFIDNDGDDDANDFYAESSSYIEFKNCSGPTGQMKDSHLKCSQADKKNINLKGNSIYEETFETNTEEECFKIFNVSDNKSYNEVINYLKNHTTTCLFINFTGDCNFTISKEFQRKMTTIFQNNGYTIKFNKLEFKQATTMNFMNFDFNNTKIENKETLTFVNCSFHNKNGEDQAIRNEGSLTLINCSIYSNDCNNEIIYNLGILATYDSRFWNNTFDHDDKGLIHNNGGSVTCLNTSFNETEGWHIYNFATGDCAIIGYDNNPTKVKFDKPWSNAKTGFIKGAFTLGTCIISYGAGSLIGYIAPTFMGFIGAAIAGAGIGFAGGLTYSYLEGRAYHDYSNLWNNALSFTLLGLSMSNIGWSTYSSIRNKMLDLNNPNGANGGENPQDFTNMNLGRNGNPNDLYQDPIYREALNNYIQQEMRNLEALNNQYPGLINYYSKTFTSLANNIHTTLYDMLNFLATIQFIISTHNLMNNNLQSNNAINIINNANNNINNNENNNIIFGGQEYPNPFISISSGLISDFLTQSNHLMMSIDSNENLRYLRDRIYSSTYSHADNNITHTDRVLRFFSDFWDLYNGAHNYGFHNLNNSLTTTLRLFYDTWGPRATPHAINRLFNDSGNIILTTWERIYRNAEEEFTKAFRNSGLKKTDVNNKDKDTQTIIKEKIEQLYKDIGSKIAKNNPDYDKYTSMNLEYENNIGTDNIDYLWYCYNILIDINNTIDINYDTYNNMVSFNYTDSIKKNIYNGIFKRESYISHMPENALTQIKSEIKYELNILKLVDTEFYEKILEDNLENKDFDEWFNEEYYLLGQSYNEASKVKLMVTKLKYLYESISEDLSEYRKSDINEDYIYFYQIRYLLDNYRLAYCALNDKDKLIVNKYLYEQCNELIKAFDGVELNGVAIESYVEKLYQLRNIKDYSIAEFNQLTDIYRVLMTTKNNQNIFSNDISEMDSNLIAEKLIKDLAQFYLINRYMPNLEDENNLTYFIKILHYGNTNELKKLTEIYNQYYYLRQQYDIFYKIENNIKNKNHIDLESYNQLTNEELITKLYLKFTVLYQTPGMKLNEEIFWRTLNLDNELMPNEQNKRKMNISNIIFILLFNKYINTDITEPNVNFKEMFLVEGSGYITVKVSYAAKDYYDKIVAELPNKEEVLDRLGQLNPIKTLTFSEIDATGLIDRINLFKIACPVGHHILTTWFQKKYGIQNIQDSQWKFDKDYNGYVNIEGVINEYYYEFCNETMNTMKIIMEKLGILDKDNNIIFESVNYTIGRLIDNENFLNNIFNKKQYFMNIGKKDNEKDKEQIIAEMEHDLIYLKNIKAELYDDIMNGILDKTKNFNEWVKKQEKLEYSTLLKKYSDIFDQLGKHRNSQIVLDNEINVIINQLDENTIDNLDTQADLAEMKSKIYSQLAYFINFWDTYNNNKRNPNILNMKLYKNKIGYFAEIYHEIMDLAIYHVFDDKIDLNALNINQMKDLFLNNLYRAYHSSERFGCVFDILKEKKIHYNSFKEYENFINSIQDKNTIIKLYNDIHNKILEYKKEKPNDKGEDEQNKNLEKMKEIINSENYQYEEPNSINTYNKDESHFRGALNKLNEEYHEAYKNILDNVIKNMDEYIESHYNNFEEMRKEIIDYLEKIYNNEEVKPSINNDDMKAIISSDEMSKIEEIINSKEYKKQSIIVQDENGDVNPFIVALEEFAIEYPKIYENVNKTLIIGDIPAFIKKHNYDVEAARKEILEFLKKLNNDHVEKLEEEGILTDDQYNEIKKIMKNKTINPTKKHHVISDSLRKLYGSWDLIEEKYPNIAKEIKSYLFGKHENLLKYAIIEGDPENGYETIRQNIIDFVRANFYKKEDKDIGISEKIPEEYIYKLTVEEIYETVTKSILEPNLEEVLAHTLYTNAVDTFCAYKEFSKLMENAGIRENYYADKVNDFKNRLLNILKEANLNKDICEKQILKDIENILNEKIIEDEEINLISNENPDYRAFKKSWKKIEETYPLIAKDVINKLYENDMKKLEIEISKKGDEETRKKIFDYIKNHFSSNEDNNAPNQQGGLFEIHKEDIGTKKNSNFFMTKVMEGAIANAKRYIETIQKKDENLAKRLNESVDKINGTFLPLHENEDYASKYNNLIDSLNDLFKEINPNDYIDYIELDNWLIEKEALGTFNSQDKEKNFNKILYSIESAYENVVRFSNNIGKYNQELFEKNKMYAYELNSKYSSNSNLKGSNYDVIYNNLVDHLNQLIIDSYKLVYGNINPSQNNEKFVIKRENIEGDNIKDFEQCMKKAKLQKIM
ncbi:hypothetical protein [uncultured Methanobrevibacter sp.]|uniref:hypothetical protein n=1 Tax=uncultured Methanobrevibacter sp. TaxID=253161 RepID=UPI0025F61A91|nr:hypothetical protein [uncultured Methanobrevibacter sp.]